MTRKSLTITLAIVLTGLCLVRLADAATTGLAASQAAGAPTAAPGSAGPIPDPRDLATFFDGMLPYALRRSDIPGAVVVVVKNGAVLFARGYGYAEIGKRVPVSPDRTLFRIGSISKLFTWTSVMQLVQAGKIDLDRDVNDYLDFRIPEKFGAPITMRDLMTHTAGFEDGGAGTFVRTAANLVPLRAYLLAHMPERIYPPGRIVAYSNYGAALAGYIVQRLSGEPFDQYVHTHILSPLRMTRSSFAQPLPPALAKDMAKGYLRGAARRPWPFELLEIAPAGAMSATGMDMAHFMIAQLQNGAYRGAAILQPATIALMHSPQSRMAPGMNGFDLGFYQENRNGLRIIGHAGDTIVFHSDMHLLLDEDVGLFLAFNARGLVRGEAESVRTQIFREFLDRYFPYTPPKEATVPDPLPDSRRVAGWYEPSRRVESALRLYGAFRQTEVTAYPDGTITVGMLKKLSGTPRRWREVGPLVYREVGGQAHLRFVKDAAGRISYWISDDSLPIEVFQRVHGLRRLATLRKVGGASIAVWLITLALWVGGPIARRRYGRELELPTLVARLRLASRVGVVLLVAVAGGWLINLIPFSARKLLLLYIGGVLGAVGAVVILTEAAARIRRSKEGHLARLGAGLLGLSALYALWAIAVLGLASFNFNY